MKKIRDENDRLNSELFVGRAKELQIMKEAVESQKGNILHIHAIGGLGKTALLRQFCHMNPSINCFRLNLLEHSVDPTIKHRNYSFLIEKVIHSHGAHLGSEAKSTMDLEHLPSHLQSLIVKNRSTVLLLDSFDSWEPLYDWMRKIFFPSLPDHMHVFTFSPFPFNEFLLEEVAYERKLLQLELQPLDQIDSFQFLQACDINDFETCHYLAKFSRGIPLALRKLCEDTKQEGIDYVRSNYYKRHFYDFLSHYLLHGVKLNDTELNILDAASLLWNFDFDLISHLLDGPISTQSFRKFCRLPFVELTSSGWRVYHFSRYWFRKEFAKRAPKRYTAFQKRAKSYWLEKLDFADVETKQELNVNLLHLSDNDALHTFCFQESLNQFVIRPLPKNELNLVRDMFDSFHKVVPAFFRETTYQEQYLETYWELSPETFYGFYRSGQLVMFMSMLPLTNKIRAVLQKNPVYSNFIEKSEYTENESMMWIASFLPEYGASAVGRSFLHGFSQLAGRGRMVVITPFLEAHQLIEGIGFERLTWADYTTKDGLLHKAYRIGLEDIRTLHLLIKPEKDETRFFSYMRLSKEETIDHMKNLLVHFHDIEKKADIVSRCPYLQVRSHSHEELMRATKNVRQFIITTIDTWSDRSGTSAVYGQVIRMCYINKFGTHESIAHFLNLSNSTYYRYLKKAIELLAESYDANLVNQHE